MSQLMKFAEDELRIAGWFNDEMDSAMAHDVLELIETFGKQGHSGMTAPMCIKLFTELASYHNLTPLTGADDEWMEVGDGVYQNKRLSTIFKESGKAYNIEGKIFRDPDGSMWTNGDSRVDIAFPYTYREPIIVDRIKQGN